jgi:hypothetical protein
VAVPAAVLEGELVGWDSGIGTLWRGGLGPVGLGNPLAAAGAPLSVGLDLYGSLALPIHWRNIVATEQTSCFEAHLLARAYATLKRAAELQGRSLTNVAKRLHLENVEVW